MAGGSQLLVHQLASGLAQRDYNISLLCGGPVEPQSLYRVVDSGGQYSQYVRVPFHYPRSFRAADLLVEVCNGMGRGRKRAFLIFWRLQYRTRILADKRPFLDAAYVITDLQ